MFRVCLQPLTCGVAGNQACVTIHNFVLIDKTESCMMKCVFKTCLCACRGYTCKFCKTSKDEDDHHSVEVEQKYAAQIQSCDVVKNTVSSFISFPHPEES